MSIGANKKVAEANSPAVILPEMPKSRLPELIERAMRNLDLSYREIEHRSRRGSEEGISSNYVQELHRGHKQGNLTIAKIIALARGLGESPITVFEAVSGKLHTGVHEKSLAQIIEDYAELPVRDREELKLMIELLRKEIADRKARALVKSSGS